MESRNIGWCWWQLKKMGVNNPLEIKSSPSWQVLVNYWLKNGPKPSAHEAQAALNELLANIQIRNNIYHRDVTDAMFRQVGSTWTLPFKEHVIKSGAVIRAVDYDLGREGYAYRDNDTARYQYATPATPSAGNRGWSYRNDGVDIEGHDASRYDVFSIEDGEWLQYTVSVEKAGRYTIAATVAAAADSGRLTLLCDDKPMAQNIVIPATGGTTSWQAINLKGIDLPKGTHRLRLVATKGGFDLDELSFSTE
ncbi:carbohydrate-binding protein [Puia sp. P3]|uniref:carbohydrate-binding protein n=1 Tax=Puia sp. P3 TaxID=3423952 RepID=UPI003D67B21F